MTLTEPSTDPAQRPMPAVDLDALIAAAHTDYRQARPLSQAADGRARQVMPGGNTRSVLDFAPFPFRVDRGEGSELIDVDGLR